MRPVNFTLTGSNTSNPIPLDYLISPFQVSIGVGPVTGTVSYTLQYTYDDVFASGYSAGSGNWFTNSLMSGLTAAGDTIMNAGPVRAIRIANVGSGSLVVNIVQAGTGA